jgi:hypothetical protein
MATVTKIKILTLPLFMKQIAAGMKNRAGSFERLAERELIDLDVQHAELPKTPGLADRFALNVCAPFAQFGVKRVRVVNIDIGRTDASFFASDSSWRIFYIGIAERSCFDATKLFPD